MAGFDIKGAKEAGYSDAEITEYLKQQPGFDVAGAKSAGYSDAEIIKHVAEQKSPDYQRGAREVVGGTRGLMSVIQGPTLGFGDEILGAVGGAYDTLKKGGKFAENYAQNRDYVRGAQDAESKENPWTSAITQGMASAPLAVIGKAAQGAQAVAPTGVMAQMLRSIPSALGYGAASGAGNSTAETMQGVAGDAAMGAATSGALSAAAVPVGRVLGAVGGTVKSGMSGIASKVDDGLESLIGIRTGAGNNFAKSAQDQARMKIAEQLLRDARGTVVQSGASSPVAQALKNYNRLGPESTVMDSGGQNTKNLLDTLATLPGRTKQAVEDVIHSRQASAGARMRSAADSALDTAGQRLPATVDDLIAKRTQDSSPLYERVRALSVEPSQELEKILQIADNIGAMKEARKSATASGAKFTYDLKDPYVSGVTNAPVIKGVSMGDMDHVKRGIDQMIEAEKNAVTGKLSPIGAKYQALKQRLVNELDAVTTDTNTGVSVYKQARSAFEGPSKLIDAANAGKKSISQDEASITNAVKSMAEDELQAFRIGAFEGLRGKLGTQSGRTDITNMWKNPTTQERLKVIFGDERKFREFAADVAKESRLKSIDTVGRGSQTASRQYGAGDLDVGAIQSAVGAVTGDRAGLLASALNTWNRVKTPEPVRDKMGEILLSQRGAGSDEIRAMEQMIQQLNRDRANAARTTGIASGLATNQAANNGWFPK